MDDLISRQAAIDEINHICPVDTEYDCALLDRVDVRCVLSDLPPAGPRWIPVTERLPEEECKDYWICTDRGYQCECRWTNVNHFWTNLTTDWHWNVFDVPQYSHVVAWMPLPECYRGDGNGE